MSDPDPQKTVFISYRRSVSSYIARAIFLDLRDHGYDVFMDVESIDSGTFGAIILNQIAARAHFLIICTPGSFEKCAQPGDLVRHEIETAMDRQRNIVPVLANGFSFEEERRYLTGKLANLPSLNGLLLVHDYFEAGMERLRDRYLKQPVAGAILAAPLADQTVVAQKIDQAAAQPPPTSDQLTAEEHFNRGLARDPADLAGKVADYSQVIQLNPSFAMAYNNRGWVLARQGELDRALADYDRAIQLDPTSALTYNNRGSARANRGDDAGAIADFGEAIRLDPNNANVYYNRGVARSRAGDHEGAMADYGQVIRLEPTRAAAYNNRGVARYHKGDLEGALEDVNMALGIDPADPEILDSRGEIDVSLGRYEEALADFQAALSIDQAASYALAGLAITLYALGQIDEAQSRWRALIDADPRYRDADWVGKELNWRPELIEAARKLIAELDA